MPTLLVVDGLNLHFQMFYGMPSRIINKNGKAIQGTLGFVGALIKIIKRVNPTYVVVIFDGEHENDRTELLDDYKANRIDYSQVPENDNPFSQLHDVYSALDCMGIMRYETTKFEADDVIASYVYTYGHKNQISIASFDSDFFQLINDNVSVLRYRGDKTYICNTEYLKTKYGIMPYQYAEFKSLTGDNSDNIKGAVKVGPKTAAQLLTEFSTLENIITNCDKIKRPSIRESIMCSTKRLKTNYKLIKLENKAPIPIKLNELNYKYNGVTTNEILIAIGLR